MNTAPTQRRKVLLDGRVLPHLGVHRGSDENRRAGREECRGEQIIRDAGRVLAEELRCSRCDDDQVGGLTQSSVWDRFATFGTGEQRRARRFGCQRRERERSDEAQRVGGEDGGDVRTGVDETPTDLHGLVGRDSPGDAENDSATTQCSELGSGFHQIARARCAEGATRRRAGPPPPRVLRHRHQLRSVPARRGVARPRSCRPRSPRARW